MLFLGFGVLAMSVFSYYNIENIIYYILTTYTYLNNKTKCIINYTADKNLYLYKIDLKNKKIINWLNRLEDSNNDDGTILTIDDMITAITNDTGV